MRKIEAHRITDLVEQLCIEACCVIPVDLENGFKSCLQQERSPRGKQVLTTMLENARIARDERVPMCQDTGMTVIFVAMGQEVNVPGDLTEEAINKGVGQGYVKENFR